MKIEKIKINNFKVYKHAELKDLPNLCVFLGANGAGKTTLFEIFGFLSNALKNNVTTAIKQMGGFKEVYSRNGEGDIRFEIKFRNTAIAGVKQPLITYELCIAPNEQNKKMAITKEILSYRRGNTGRPYRFLDFANGRGYAITNEDDYTTQNFEDKREEQILGAADILAIKGLGQFQKFKAISSFRRLLENWYVSNFQIQTARFAEENTDISEHLSTTGNNLAQVTQFIYEHHPDIFQTILDKMKQRVPGIESVQAVDTLDGRILLQFKDGSFKDPFMIRNISDGTIKMFAYLVLIYDPEPHPLLCVEEPENYLHHALLSELAEEFRAYAKRGGQVFISTHSPDFVNALKIEELFWLKKTDGNTTIECAKNDDMVRALYEDGEQLGALWKQGYLFGSSPKDKLIKT